MLLWDLGWNVFAIDYRGYGRSDGEPTEEGLYLDALAGLDALRAREDIEPDRVIIWGYSMGTGVASYAAHESPGGALVLETPYTSMAEQVSGSMPLGMPSTWLVGAQLDTLGRMPTIHCPVVVAHGTEDVRIPLRMAEDVFAAANEPKRFVLVEGGGHAEILRLAGARMRDALGEMDPALLP
jgi:pimeloyl-ACP methyl ester carboxylesterase